MPIDIATSSSMSVKPRSSEDRMRRLSDMRRSG